MSKARGCPADATITRTNPSETVRIRQTTRMTTIPRHLRRSGFVLRQRAWLTGTGTKAFEVNASKYTAYRIVGGCIERVSLNRSTRVMAHVGLDPRHRAWVRGEVGVVADRLSGTCTGTPGLG